MRIVIFKKRGKICVRTPDKSEHDLTAKNIVGELTFKITPLPLYGHRIEVRKTRRKKVLRRINFGREVEITVDI